MAARPGGRTFRLMSKYVNNPRARQAAATGALVLFTLWLTIAQWGSQGFGQFEDTARNPDGFGFLLVLLTAASVTLRRSNPLGTIALGGLTSIALVALDYGELVYIAPAVGLFTVAAHRAEGDPRVVPAIAMVAGVWLTTSVLQVINLDADGSALTAGALIYIGAWLLGDRVREGRRRRTEKAQRTVAEERAHIARELHDSAGHAINVILVQAGAARVQAERDPAASREALQTVEAVARETLGEIDRIVGALRSDGDGSDGEAEPLPGLGAIDNLAQRHRDAGMDVTLNTSGTRRALAGSVDRAAYRIVQEALTNAARHGEGGATVEVEYGADELRLTATNRIDPMRAVERDGGGRGLVGMRERATLLGGGLDVARQADTFRVSARLPYDAPEEA